MSKQSSAPNSDSASRAFARARRSCRRRSKSIRCSQSTAMVPCVFRDICASSVFQPGHLRQHIKQARKIFLFHAHTACSSKKFVADGGGGQRNVQLPAHFHGQQHVFLHHVHVEPGLVRLLHCKRAPILHHRR